MHARGLGWLDVPWQCWYVHVRHPSPDGSVARRGLVSTRTLGTLAVAITIVIFSFASTLVKRAGTAAELVAFWRMVMTSLVWNGIVLMTGRRPSWRSIRLAALPGVFFGLDIAFFYLGATHNSVANAEMISAMTPFILVPIGAAFFGERLHSRALFFAFFAVGGVAIVLFAAPTSGDASLRGCIFGVIALGCWAGYISCTRRLRGEMDVASYMAAMTPVATVAVLPLALAHGDMLSITAHGWKYIVLLTLMTGVLAHGLMVFAQSTIPIGSIGIAQVAQPALAALWSFLLLDEVLNGWQVLGMGIVIGGLLGFVVLNQRNNLQSGTLAEPVSATEHS
jgi:drug/metabolite transporter (DMT)-like permease